MARYFINIRGRGAEAFFDDTGKDFASMKSLHARMISHVAELALASDRVLTVASDWEAEALDERGKIVATLTFGLEER